MAKAEKNSRLLCTSCTPPWAGHQHIVLLILHGNLWQVSQSLVYWWETEAQRGFANEYSLITQPWRLLSPGKSQCPKIFTTKQFCREIVLRGQGPNSEMGDTVRMLQQFPKGALCPDTVLKPQPHRLAVASQEVHRAGWSGQLALFSLRALSLFPMSSVGGTGRKEYRFSCPVTSVETPSGQILLN